MFRTLILMMAVFVSAPAYANEQAQTIVITHVKEDILNPSITGVGTFSAYNDVTLKSEISGRIQAVHFKEGEYVKPDQNLFTIHNNIHQDQRAFALINDVVVE